MARGTSVNINNKRAISAFARVVFVWLLCIACLSLSCILSPDLSQFYDPTTNNAPRLLINGIDPSARVIEFDKSAFVRGEINEPPPTFKALQVADKDVKDTLYAYWFLYTSKKDVSSLRCFQPFPASENNPLETRRTGFSCPIPADLLEPGKSYVVEVIVSDRQPLSSTPDPNGELTWPENARRDRHVWVLTVK